MSLDFDPPLSTCEPPLNFKPLIDQDDAIPVHEHIAVSVFDETRASHFIWLWVVRPFVTARHAFIALRVIENIGHFAHRTGRFTHKGNRIAVLRAGTQNKSAARGSADLHVGHIQNSHEQVATTTTRFGQAFAGEPDDFSARNVFRNRHSQEIPRRTANGFSAS